MMPNAKFDGARINRVPDIAGRLNISATRRIAILQIGCFAIDSAVVGKPIAAHLGQTAIPQVDASAIALVIAGEIVGDDIVGKGMGHWRTRRTNGVDAGAVAGPIAPDLIAINHRSTSGA